MILLLSTLAFATSVGMFPLKLLPKSTKQSTQQQDVQKYIQSTLIDLSKGKDLEVVTQSKWIKRLEGTDYYNDLLKNCKKSDCIKGAAVAGQVPFVIATRFYSYKSINSMTIYLYEVDHPLFSPEESNVANAEENTSVNDKNSQEKTAPTKESRRDKRKRKRRERKQEQQLSTTMNPFSSLGAVRLIEQQSCSAGPKEDLLTNCQSSVMELLDGQLGLVNLLHPFTVRGPEPIRSCLQEKLPDVPYARDIELRQDFKPAETAAYRATAKGKIQMLVDGVSFIEIEWSSEADTTERALQNVKSMNNLQNGVTQEGVCQQLADRLTLTGYRDAGE